MNYFDQPAQSQMINTYVQAPYQEILQAGLARQGRYDETLAAIQANQEYLDQLQAIQGTVHEDYLNQSRQKIEDISNQFSNKDLSDPFIRRQLRDEIRKQIDPTTINRIVQSKQNYDLAQKMKAEYDMRGLYYDPYDAAMDPARNKSLQLKELYSYTPRAFQDPEKMAGKYFESISPTKVVVPDEEFGIFKEVTSRSLNQLTQAVDSNWRTFADTPQGQWVLMQYRQRTGDNSTPDESVVKGYMNDVAKRYVMYAEDTAGQIPGWTERSRGGKDKDDYIFNASSETQNIPNENRINPKDMKETLGFRPDKIKEITDILEKGEFDRDGNLSSKTFGEIDNTAAGRLNKLRQEKYNKKLQEMKTLVSNIKKNSFQGKLADLNDLEALDAYRQAYNDIEKVSYNTFLYETDEVSTSAREKITRQVLQDITGRDLMISESGKEGGKHKMSLEDLYKEFDVPKDQRQEAFDSIKIKSIVPSLGGYEASMVVNGTPRNFTISPNKREQYQTNIMQAAIKKHNDGQLGDKEFAANGKKYILRTVLDFNEDTGSYEFVSNIRTTDGSKEFPTLEGGLSNNMRLDLYEQYVASQLNIQQ